MNFFDNTFELKEIQRLEGHSDRVWSVSWKPATGTGGVPAVLASCSGDKTVRIWEQTFPSGSFHCKSVIDETHTRTVRSCAWSPTGKLLATASFDGSIAIWEENGDDFQCVTTLEGHENEVKSVSWNASGTLLATCGRDKSVWIWEVMPGNEYDCASVLQGHTQDVKMVRWHPSVDILFSCSYDNTIKVWADEGDSDDWHCIQTLTESNSGHTSTVWALSFNARGDQVVTCSDDLSLKVWGADIERMQSGDVNVPWRHISTLSGYHDRTIFSVHWSREGIICSGAADDAIRLFVENKKDNNVVDGPTYRLLLKKEKAHEMDVNAVQWNTGDKRMLASASDDGTVKIWELVPKCG